MPASCRIPYHIHVSPPLDSMDPSLGRQGFNLCEIEWPGNGELIRDVLFAPQGPGLVRLYAVPEEALRSRV